MKRIKTLIASSILLAVVAVAPNASAVLITPSTTPVWTGSDNSNFNAAAITAIVGGSALTEVYKQNVGGDETGSFASSYATSFSNTAADPSDALIDYGSGSSISGSSIFLYVKDGNQNPAYYIFDISTWNGTDDLTLTGFWPRQGAISHVAILTRGGSSVPDAGTTVALLGAGLIGVGALRRRFSK